MSANPKNNHYQGLLAEWYDRLLTDEKNDIEFYKEIVRKCRGKVLELACGTGRLLVPFKKAGADVEGLDISIDMLDICEDKLKKNKLSAKLYTKDISNFKLDNKYELIFISGGSFQLIDSFEGAETALKNVYDHLEPGGLFVLDIFNLPLVHKDYQNNYWKLGRTARNEKGEKLWCHSCAELDYVEQIEKGKYKYELYKDDKLVETLAGGLNLRWYGKYEFRMLLEKTGFSEIKTETENIMSTHNESIVYYAYKN